MSECPYPGLRSFTRFEDKFFFGREEQVDAALLKLRGSRFLPVVGPSGCGKSSLIRAGLMASLEGGLMDEVGARWEMAEMRPGKHPYAALAEALLNEERFRTRFNQLEQGPPEPEVQAGFLLAELKQGPRGLCDVLERNGLPNRTNFLLLVDQFEEIFTARREEKEEDTDAFVAMLLASTIQRELPVYVIITMRTDYLGDCTVFRDLAEAINRTFFLTPRLTREQKRDAIAQPARLSDGTIQRDLLNELVNTDNRDPDHLPLLQHLLMRMWTFATEDRSGTSGGVGRACLTSDHYEKAGGFNDALSKHAGEAFEELTPKQKKIAEVLFRALSEISPDQRERRRLATVQEVADLSEATLEEVINVANVFRRPGRNFLVPALDQVLTAESALDISHEALIRNWDMLRKWAKWEAESAEMFVELKKADSNYKENKGGFLDTLGIAIRKKWIKREKPTQRWSVRYGGELERALGFLRLCENKKFWEKVRLCGGIAFALLITISISFAWVRREKKRTAQALRDDQIKKEKALSERIVERGLGQLEKKEYDPRFNALSLREFGRALQAWPSNPQAAKHASNLLSCNWCPPITPALLYKPDSPLLAAAFDTETHFFAIGLDGSLLEQKEGSARLEPRRTVLVEKELPNGMSKKLISASFSANGDRLVVVPAASSKESVVTAVAQIWKRHPPDYIFVQQVPLNALATTIPTYRNFIWNKDRSIVIATMWQPGGGSYDVFQWRDNSFRPIPGCFPNGVAAACFDNADKILAICETKSNISYIQLCDARSLTPLEPSAKLRRTSFPVKGRCMGLTFICKDQHLLVSGFGGWSDIDLATGEVANMTPPTIQDQFIRFVVPSVEVDRLRFAAALANRVLYAEASPSMPDFAREMDYPVNEPICIRGTAALPVFNDQGTRLLTLSGTVWNAMDSLRVWDVAARPEGRPVTFNGEDAPNWLGPLALAVSGLRTAAEEEDEAASTMKEIEQTFEHQGKRDPYLQLWKRYFPSK